MAKAKGVQTVGGSFYGYSIRCPGCKDQHTIKVGANGWTFSGDLHKPTFNPSLLVHPHGALAEDGTVYQTPRCHSFIKDGQIQFLKDCTHPLAGQTVELPDWE